MTHNGGLFYYVTNTQGDVIGILDASGNQVVSYTYDAWGNILNSTESESGTLGTLSTKNPLRYRGYVYDQETGFYYLQPRYYNPEIGRFINADDLVSTGQGLLGNNMFAYCNNNPVAFRDDSGESAILTTLGIMAIGGLIGTVISAASSALTQKALTGSVNWKSVGVAAATGFISGAIAASPVGIVGQIAIGGAIGTASYVADCYVNDADINVGEAALSCAMGMISGAIGGPCANEGMALTDTIEQMGKAAAREARRANQKYATKALAKAIDFGFNNISCSTWEASIRFSAGCGVANGVTQKACESGWFSEWRYLRLQ